MAASTATGLAITNPLVKYRALLATKQIAADPAQHRLAIHLSKLYERLKDYEPTIEYSRRLDQISKAVNASPRSDLSSWRYFQGIQASRDTLALTRRLTSHESAQQIDSPQGLMLHGEVGTGKSMLIDLFADCLPNRKKRRWHFNTFMLETFAKLEAFRQARSLTMHNAIKGEDDYSLLWLAKEMIQTSPIIFLDEFQMPDRVASKILTNLMTSFFHLGGVLVATSNRMPEELAKAAGIAFGPPPATVGVLGWSFGSRKKPKGSEALFGGQGEFAAFLEVLKARCEVWEMEGGKDYRRISTDSLASVNVEEILESWRTDGHEDLQHSQGMAGWEAAEEKSAEDDASTPSLPQHFHIASDPADTMLVRDAINEAVKTTTASLPFWTPTNLTVYGRTLAIPQAHQGITIWTFDDLCRASLGPADYITIASTFHTLILTHVPVLTWLMKNEARRFITLLDALYECRCKLFISAAAGPDDIFFPDERRPKSTNPDDGSPSSTEAVYSETLSEVYQDATAPFRPNILSQNPNYAEPDAEPDYTHARLAGLLSAQQLEDDTPMKPSRLATSPGGGEGTGAWARSFGRTDAELMAREKGPVDPDDVRVGSAGRVGTGGKVVDFSRTSAFTGEDERFAYRRAESRLWEMCSERWWARSEEGWHRPLPKSARRWEGGVGGVNVVVNGDVGSDGRESDVGMGGAVEDSSRDERSFRRVNREINEGAVDDKRDEEAKVEAEAAITSPYRTASESPPKFSWMHFWGTMQWGKRAGAWGQGPEGLKEREKEK